MTPLCKSYEGIVVQRFFLGLMEGAANPAWLHIIGMWYLKKEQALMALVVNSGPAFFGLIYGSLMYGVTQIGEEDHAWKVVFYFVGPMTILGALFLLYWIPDSPASSKWLSPRERYVVRSVLSCPALQSIQELISSTCSRLSKDFERIKRVSLPSSSNSSRLYQLSRIPSVLYSSCWRSAQLRLLRPLVPLEVWSSSNSTALQPEEVCFCSYQHPSLLV